MSAPSHPFTNRLAQEKSPYLLQHAHNPVDWYPWGAEALSRAREQNKPIFLSVGYSACHWCHVMERESFEDEATARILNEHFIPVKVDREERPDVDEIYMTAVQMMTRHGGWPMSVFLTPDGRPFYGGTYFPPEDRHGRIGFKTLLRELAKAYHERHDEIENVAAQLAQDLQEASRQRPAPLPRGASLETAALLRLGVQDLAQRFDATHGGFGDRPKFPPHHALALLLEVIRRDPDGDGKAAALPMLTRTLDHMALGGIYDHIGGGFHRYSTDDIWLLPHFEKMLYYNALLARVYSDAYRTTVRAAYARVARETCDWVLRDMTDAEGGFHAALDADSEGEEGKYYVWTLREVQDSVGHAGASFAERYNIRPGGNFHDEATGRPTGTNIPHLSGPDLPDEIAPEDAEVRARLLAVREQCVPPGKDDKIITAWNGLMIGGLAFAGHTLGEEGYIEAARRAADFCLTVLSPGGKLLRRYRDGDASFDAYLEDYAFLADGLLDLHDATGEARWADAARRLAETLLTDFWDHEDGGFFFTGARHETLVARSKELFDGATPSPNGVAARVLARLGGLPGGQIYAARAQEMLHAFAGLMHHAPQGTQTLALAAVRAAQNAPPEERADAAPEIVTLTPEGAFPLRLPAKPLPHGF